MYKLVVVGGKLRGEEHILEEGESILGSDSECDIPLQIDGISRRHVKITVNNNVCYIEDLGSANGTFLNGKLIRRTTVRNGDKIALPDIIIQVVYVIEKKKIIKKKAIATVVDEKIYITGGSPPETLFPKLLWIFRYKLMKFIHGINEEYEWRVMFGIILFVFILFTVTATIFPVLENSKLLLLREVAARGAHYADEIDRMNRRHLRLKKLDKVDTAFLNKEGSVKEYRLYDLDGRVIRPIEMINEYISDPFFVQVKDYYDKGSNHSKTYLKRLPNSTIGVGRVINAYNPKTGLNEAIGIIALKFSPSSLQIEGTVGRKAYVEALVITTVVAVIFFLMIYYMTLRPIEDMKFQIEEAITGKRKILEGRWLMSEIDGLRVAINSLVQRVRELSGEADDEFIEDELDEEYTARLSEFMKGSDSPTIVLDSEKNVAYINSLAEDLTGIRESSSQGESIMDVSRERGFSATVVELCDNSADDDGKSYEGSYELGGDEYAIYVSSLIGRDSFAKAFYITFIKQE